MSFFSYKLIVSAFDCFMRKTSSCFQLGVSSESVCINSRPVQSDIPNNPSKYIDINLFNNSSTNRA